MSSWRFPIVSRSYQSTLLSLLEQLALLVSVGCFIRTRLLTSPWDSYPIASLPSPLSSQCTLSLVGSLRHCYTRPIAKCLLPVSTIIKKEESPIVVPLLGSGDEETKSEEHSPLPSLCYPSSSSSSSRASSWLSLYCTRSPAHCFSSYRRGDSSDSTYHLASIIRSLTPLAQPIDWNPVYNYGIATDTTIIPSSLSSETYINPIGNALRHVFLPSEVLDLMREGL